MARNFSSPLLQRPGMVDPQERRRRPLNPLEDYPYEPEMPEVPMPQMGALPVPDISPGMAAPRLAPVNPTGWDTPPRDLSQFRAWYSGQPVEGAPAAPEWGRDTQTYSRLNPVQPKTTPERTIVPPRAPKMPTAGQTLGGGQPQVMQRPRGPVRPNAPMPSFNAPMGQQAMEQMQAREQRFFTPQQGPTMAAGMQQVTQAGGGAQPLANQARRQMLGQAANNLAVVPEAGSARQAFNQFAQSLGTGLAGIPRGLAAAAEETFGAGSPVPENWRQRTAVAPPRALSQALKEPTQAAQRSIQQAFPVNPQDQSWLTSKIPAGFGSAGAFMTAAGLGRLTGAPINAITGAAGVGMSVDQFLNEVEQTGIDPKRYSAGVKVATASGLSELVGFGNLLDKFGLKRAAIERGLDVLKDGGQEAFQGYLEDLNRKYVAANAPQTNVDVTSADFWFKRGEEFALGAIVSAPLALIPGRDGGVSKVPDAIESETTPGGTGATTRIPQSEQQRRYSDWVAAGGTPAPFASQVGLRRPRQLPGRGALPGTPEGQRALPPIPTQPEPPSARVEAPFQPSPPTAPTGIRPQAPTEARPVTSAPSDVSFRPLETVGAPGARPVGLYERPILQSALQGQGIEVQAEIEDKLPALRSEYEAKVAAGRRVKAEPGPGDVKGEYGMAASRMHRTADAILEKFMGPFGIEARGQRRSVYPEVLSNITAEMQEIVPDVTESEVESAAKAGTKAEGRMREGVYDIWEQWHERFGREKGLSEQDTLAMKNLVAGRKGLFFRPDVQAALGLTPGDPTANKQVHDIIREDMAKLMGMPPEVQGKPLKGVSLSLIPPHVWHNWMSLRGLNDETKFPGFREEMEDILRNQGRISDSVVRGESAPTPPAPTKPKAPPSPVTPKAPPSPAAPVAPSGPSALLRRYQGMTSVGMPRAPRTFVPGVPSRQQGPGFTRRSAGGITTGRPQGPRGIRGLLPDIDQETREEQEARAARERLKSRSPFARGRQAEQERIGQAIEGRRPPTPPEAVTPAPTPPTLPPAPAGEAVTPPTPRKATPVKKESAPKPAAPTGQPITEKSLTEQGWTKNSSTDFSGPNGERLEYDSNRRGGPWVYTDRSGNTESFASAREAIQGILSRPAATPAPEAPVTPKTTKPRKAEAAPVSQTTQAEGSGQTEAGTSTPARQKAIPAQTPLKTLKPMPSKAADFTLKGGEDVPSPSEQLNDYVINMSAMQKARTIATLTKTRLVKGNLTTHADYLEKAITAGAKIITRPNGERRLVLPGDSFFLEKDFSKQAFDYGEHLMRQVASKLSAATPVPETTQPKEEATSTPATTEQAVAEARKLMRELATELGVPNPDDLTLDKLVRIAEDTVRGTEKKPKKTESVAPSTTEAEKSEAELFPDLAEQRKQDIAQRKELIAELFPDLVERRKRNIARRKEFIEDNPDLPLTVEDYLKTVSPEVQSKYARYKALRAKFQAAQNPVPGQPQVRFGATSNKQMKELENELRFITDEVGLAKSVLHDVVNRAPVKAVTVDGLEIKLPKGYERQGNKFVFQAEPAAAKGVETAPAEVKEIFREIDAGKNKRTVRRRVQDDYKDGKKALFVADNIEQIIAEAEATGKVTKVCP